VGKGTTWVFHADHLQETYKEPSAKGVKFVRPPVKQPWGNEAIFEDPYGNRYALMGA
jgi:predicted enzyme related to lactoylglutathione lyase